MVRTEMFDCDMIATSPKRRAQRAKRKKLGRPKNPASEASQRPWEKLKMSRTSYYVRKRYGDL